MNKTLCIFPQDQTTSFLEPVYDELCQHYDVVGLKGDPTEDDEYLKRLEAEIDKSDTVIFLGHGSSEVLYGINFNMLICLENGNVGLLKEKRLVLFACHSSDFIKRHNLKNALGFGEIPTSDYDVANGYLHGLLIKELTVPDVEYIKTAIVRIWKKSLAEVGLTSLHRFYKAFEYYTVEEIVWCLRNRESRNFRLIADVLYYIKMDMDFVG